MSDNYTTIREHLANKADNELHKIIIDFTEASSKLNATKLNTERLNSTQNDSFLQQQMESNVAVRLLEERDYERELFKVPARQIT